MRGQRARTRVVPDMWIGAHRLDHDVRRRGRSQPPADLANPSAHAFRSQPLVAVPELVAPDGSFAQHRRSPTQCLQPGRGGATDAGHLGVRLVPPALGEQPSGRVQLDAVGPQPVGQGHREVRRHGGLADVERRHRADADLLVDRPPGVAGRDQLVPPEGIP